jgi:hypothetical protein
MSIRSVRFLLNIFILTHVFSSLPSPPRFLISEPLPLANITHVPLPESLVTFRVQLPEQLPPG